MIKISKELLSEVIGEKVENIIYPSVEKYRMDLTNWCYESAGYFSDDTIKVTIQGNTYDINIYELAYKCKEWAVNLGYVLVSFIRAMDSVSDCEIWFESHHIHKFVADSEVESIIKACEWIYIKGD